MPTNTTDNINAIKSAMGPANNTPIIPNQKGSTTRRGIRKKTCLVNENSAPFIGLPMAVKKLEESNCTPFTGTIKR